MSKKKLSVLRTLILVLTIVGAFTVSAFAATVSWTLTGIQENGSNVNGLCYLLVNENISKDSVAALAGKGTKAFTDALGASSAKAFAWEVSNGTGSLTNMDPKRPSIASLGLSENTWYNFYVLCFDTATITDNSNFYLSPLKNYKTLTGDANTPVYFGSQATPCSETGAWKKVGPDASLTHEATTTNYAAISSAITAAVDGDTIKLLSDVDDNITVAKNITLDLNGHVLGMDSNSSVITIGSGLSLSIIDSATGGNVKGSCGTLNSSYYGGALHNSGVLTLADLELRDSSLSEEDSCGGAIYNDNDGTININGSMKFSGNKADEDSSSGGAIYNSGTANISGTTIFDGNKACDNGGAIFNCGTMNISGETTFTGNTTHAASDGGAIRNTGDINLSGIIHLVGGSDTLSNYYGTINWDISGVANPKTTAVPSISGYDKITNESGALKITVDANQPTGDYTIATGNFTNVTGKDNFTITGVAGETDAAVSIDYNLVPYNGKGYKLSTNDNGTPDVATDDKLVLSIIEPNYLTFTAEEAGAKMSFNWCNFIGMINTSVQFSRDAGKTWESYTGGDEITLINVGDKVSFRGDKVTTDDYSHFCIQNGKIAASGSVTSLTDGNGGDPNVELTYSCYSSMFKSCTALTKAPELTATKLAERCYSSMFKSCTALTKAPGLPATKLAEKCYSNMFDSCTALTKAPELTATTLAPLCYCGMFCGCSSLTSVPELPAKKLEASCYSEMFGMCTSLTELVDISHVEKLAEGCCEGMFYGCTGIKVNTSIGASFYKVWKTPSVTAANQWSSCIFTGTSGSLNADTDAADVNQTYYIPISAAISSISDQAFTGSEIKPTVTVTTSGSALNKGTDYTVAYSNNINIGKATVTVTGKGKYAGTLTSNFNIVSPPTYSVTFNSNGGSSVDVQYVNNTSGYHAANPGAPTLANATFDGWYRSGALFDFSTPITSDITLDAHWKFNTIEQSNVETEIQSEYNEAGSTTKIQVQGDSNVQAGGLDEIALEAKRSNLGNNVMVVLTAETKSESAAPNAANIKSEAGNDTLSFLSIDITRTITTTGGAIVSSSNVTSSAITVEVVVPFDTSNKTVNAIYRYHDGHVTKFTKTNTYADGTFYIENEGTATSLIHIFSNKFSTYAVGYTSQTTTSYSDDSPSYAVTVNAAKNGSVTVSPKYAEYGDKVTVTVTPDKGYTLETIIVTTKNGKEIELTTVKIGTTYTFKMPSYAVSITATFMEDNSMLNYFFDVTAKDYYYDAVLWAAENGITSGKTANFFAPKDTCTRAEFVTFLWRAAGKPVVNYTMPFTDVPAGKYYTEAVRWAASLGIVKGTTATTFNPSGIIDRAQAVTYIARFAGVKDDASGYTNKFSDVAAGAYYSNSVAWAASYGITSGKTADTFGPKDNCERAHVVVFLYNYFNK